MNPVRITSPLRLGRGQNDRESRWARAHRVDVEREQIGLAIIAAGVHHALKALGEQGTPLHVHIVRVTSSRGALLDDDNCVAAGKACRDELAAFLGIDDGDSRVRWTYGQDRGCWGVVITVTPEPARVVEREPKLPPIKDRNSGKHEWILWRGLESCRKCGACKPRDPERQNRPCRGVVGVSLRSRPTPAVYRPGGSRQ